LLLPVLRLTWRVAVPASYFVNVDKQAVLSGDVSAMPELACASVEYLATKACFSVCLCLYLL
jgi:hypothetical protein